MAENENEIGEAGIDFSGVKTLANTDFEKEPWYVSLGNGIVGALASGGLWLLGFLLDCLKAIWTILSGIFIYGWKLIKGIGRFFRNKSRQWREVDGAGKASFFLQGVGNIKNGQIADGIIFMSVEILFILYMVLWGGSNLYYFIHIEAQRRHSHTALINGFVTIVVCIGYIAVYIKGIQSMYDCHQITHGISFIKARQDQNYVLTHLSEYPEVDFMKDSRGVIKNKMRSIYGYSKLSASYISYTDYRRLDTNVKFNPFKWLCIQVDSFFAAMAAVCEKKKFSAYHGRFLAFKTLREKTNRGYDVLVDEVSGDLVRWHHTYDKYNLYMSTVRDAKAEISALARPSDIIAACYAEDVVSVRNGIRSVPHDIVVTPEMIASAQEEIKEAELAVKAGKAEVKFCKKHNATVNDAQRASKELGDAKARLMSAKSYLKYLKGGKLTAKAVLSRIVGVFELELGVAKTISRYAVKALESDDPIAYLNEIHEDRVAFLDRFVAKNKTNRKEESAAAIEVYNGYGEYRSVYDGGKKVWLNALKGNGISAAKANEIYDDYSLAIKNGGDVDEVVVAILSQFAVRAGELDELVEHTAYYGRPLNFKKTVKQYGDEKFATTVLALPTIGAFITCILPLLCSITIAFTAWGRNNTNYTFGWDLEAFNKVLGLTGAGDFSVTFTKLLTWTLIWAFFATFTNYIFGIILALIINKKGIRFKGMWRTFFVITIAIPQFITLLVMNVLLNNEGPINEWFRSIGVGTVPFLSKPTTDPAFDVTAGDYIFPKMMIIVVNMWIGIPYTMLSTSGILMNIPEDLYESARIDGANAWTQFWKITMPYILFVTGPSLLTSFIGNINNFNVIYFLTGGGPTVADSLGNADAGHTDLLITWLFKLTNDKYDYNTASVIGIMVFAICAFFSIVMYGRMGSVKNEEEFQ